jgi:hypothetical protein
LEGIPFEAFDEEYVYLDKHTKKNISIRIIYRSMEE